MKLIAICQPVARYSAGAVAEWLVQVAGENRSEVPVGPGVNPRNNLELVIH